MIPRIGSWTRTLNEDDAIPLLLEATPGTTLAAWEARGHDNLPQASRARRRETLRIAPPGDGGRRRSPPPREAPAPEACRTA